MSNANEYPSLLDDYEGRIDPQVPNHQRDDYQVSVSRKQIRDLESNAREGRTAAQERDRLARENLALRAGVDLDTPQGQMFVKGYDGDLDLDKVKEAATAAKVIETSTPATDETEEETEVTETPDTELEAGEADLPSQRQALAADAPSDQVPLGDPYETAVQVHDRIVADGGQRQRALGGAINSLVQAAHQGNKAVVLPSRSTQTLGSGGE